jgi:hypothetical protein
MAEKTKAFERGCDQGGVYYQGYAAGLDSCGRAVALVCPTIDDLRWAWKRLVPDADLDESAVQCVRIYED